MMNHRELMQDAKQLIHGLENNNDILVKDMLDKLSNSNNNILYQEIGKLTRELHNAISHINQGMVNEANQSNDISDAKKQLNAVVSMTENAANTTMDLIEATLPISDNLGVACAKLNTQAKAIDGNSIQEASQRDFHQSVLFFLTSVEEDFATIHKNLYGILLAQEYQDLTGQKIKQVISLFSDMELKLIRILKLAANSELSEEECKKLMNHSKQDKLYNQGQVDDLLSDLGF